MKTITSELQIGMIEASELKVGMFTIHGLITGITEEKTHKGKVTFFLEHPGPVTEHLEAGEKTPIFLALAPEVLDTISASLSRYEE